VMARGCYRIHRGGGRPLPPRAAGRTRTSAVRSIPPFRAQTGMSAPHLVGQTFLSGHSQSAGRAARRRARADEGVRPHELQAAVSYHLAIHLRAPLPRPLLRREIDVNDAEALGVAEGPFEVVQEGPDEV